MAAITEPGSLSRVQTITDGTLNAENMAATGNNTTKWPARSNRQQQETTQHNTPGRKGQSSQVQCQYVLANDE
jgi:hypothetical protein